MATVTKWSVFFSKAIYEHYFQCQNDRHLFFTYGKYKKKKENVQQYKFMLL